MNRIGETRKNKYGTEMKVVVYNGVLDIWVEFQDEHKARVHTTYTNFNKGQVRNPYDKTVYGIGYLGEGKYKVYIDQEHLEPVYNVWRTLLGRCCTEKHREQFPAYAGCVVCDEWLCYQDFADWWNQNMYHVGTERMHIDKDILHEGNKVYSPENCIIVPQSINEIFHTTVRKTQDLDLPYTIRRTTNGKYSVKYRGKTLGIYNTVEQCETEYLKAKREYIRSKVNELKNEIPIYIQDILLNW